MHVKGRQRLLVERNDDDAVKPLQKLNQRWLHRKDHGRSLSAQQRQIAGKLDCVSEPLFGIDQDRFAGERLACPGRLPELAVKVLEPVVFLKFPAPLVFAAAGLVPAL